MGLPPRDALEKLVELSASALAANRDAAALYFQEARNLPPDELTRYTRIQRNLITEWVKLLRQVRAGISDEDARVAVRAVAGMLNSVGYFTTTMPSETSRGVAVAHGDRGAARRRRQLTRTFTVANNRADGARA